MKLADDGAATPTIRVFSAIGTGPTALAAFDRALQVGGAQDTNLVVLSSVVPKGATVVRERAHRKEFTAGDRLYCVMAEARCVVPGSEAWAGIGWAVDQDLQGGLFVEAHGHSEHQVRYELDVTLDALLADRPYWNVGNPDTEVIGTTCVAEPVSALVMAIYESDPWQSR